jgi:hypothetical protein
VGPAIYLGIANSERLSTTYSQVIMLTKLGSDRSGHDLAPINPGGARKLWRASLSDDCHGWSLESPAPVLHNFFGFGFTTGSLGVLRSAGFVDEAQHSLNG